jgi:hypothetical protein
MLYVRTRLDVPPVSKAVAAIIRRVFSLMRADLLLHILLPFSILSS